MTQNLHQGWMLFERPGIVSLCKGFANKLVEVDKNAAFLLWQFFESQISTSFLLDGVAYRLYMC